MKSNLLITFKLSNFITVLCFLLFTFCSLNIINGQATLSVQGILKKSNGVALEDAEYPITFKIYPVSDPPANTALWTENIPNVEVTSGIYSVELGNITPINLAFNINYELGVSIGSQEMRPRVKLTSAPYALALRGSTNQFPSSGQVLADSILINGGIKVNNGVLAKGGTPGVNGANKAGYAFTGNNGDNDSGLFSTADGKASLYSNNAEILSVTPGTATVNGNVDIINNGSLKFNGLSDWRLVDIDNFIGGSTDEWLKYGPTTGEWIGWKNNSGTNPTSSNFGIFKGWGITPGTANDVLKKQFTIQGPTFSQIKVKFKYHFLDSWELGGGDIAFAGFASSVVGTNLRISWMALGPALSYNAKLQTTPFLEATTYYGSTIVGQIWTDHSLDIEMVGQADGNSFWLFVGAASDLNDGWPEIYGLSNVEVWVR